MRRCVPMYILGSRSLLCGRKSLCQFHKQFVRILTTSSTNGPNNTIVTSNSSDSSNHDATILPIQSTTVSSVVATKVEKNSIQELDTTDRAAIKTLQVIEVVKGVLSSSSSSSSSATADADKNKDFTDRATDKTIEVIEAIKNVLKSNDIPTNGSTAAMIAADSSVKSASTTLDGVSKRDISDVATDKTIEAIEAIKGVIRKHSHGFDDASSNDDNTSKGKLSAEKTLQVIEAVKGILSSSSSSSSSATADADKNKDFTDRATDKTIEVIEAIKNVLKSNDIPTNGATAGATTDTARNNAEGTATMKAVNSGSGDFDIAKKKSIEAMNVVKEMIEKKEAKAESDVGVEATEEVKAGYDWMQLLRELYPPTLYRNYIELRRLTQPMPDPPAYDLQTHLKIAKERGEYTGLPKDVLYNEVYKESKEMMVTWLSHYYNPTVAIEKTIASIKRNKQMIQETELLYEKRAKSEAGLSEEVDPKEIDELVQSVRTLYDNNINRLKNTPSDIIQIANENKEGVKQVAMNRLEVMGSVLHEFMGAYREGKAEAMKDAMSDTGFISSLMVNADEALQSLNKKTPSTAVSNSSSSDSGGGSSLHAVDANITTTTNNSTSTGTIDNGHSHAAAMHTQNNTNNKQV